MSAYLKSRDPVCAHIALATSALEMVGWIFFVTMAAIALMMRSAY